MKRARPGGRFPFPTGLFLALCYLCSLPRSAGASEIAWMRILAAGAEPLTWRAGEPMPDRPGGFPLEPSAVFSYANLSPGRDMDDSELDRTARRFERALSECGRFARAAVYVLETGPGGLRRGVVAEVEPQTIPGFTGGPAYATLEIPLVAGRRAALGIAAGANRDGVSYRDDVFLGLPLVLEASLAYSNDRMEEGPASTHTVEVRAGAGPRLGPLADLVFRTRSRFRREEGHFDPPLWALDAVLAGTTLGLGRPILDSRWKAEASFYPQSGEAKASVLASLRAGPGFGGKPGAAGLTLRGAAGWSGGGLDGGELFDLQAGDLQAGSPSVRGPEGKDAQVPAFVLWGVEAECSILGFSLSSWLRLDAGPFVFAETAFTGSRGHGERLFGYGGGLRIYLNPPVNIRIDLGYAAGSRGPGVFILSVTSKPLF